MIKDGYIIITHILWYRDAIGVDIKELRKTQKIKVVVKTKAGILIHPKVLIVDLADAEMDYKLETINPKRKGFFIPRADFGVFETDEVHDGKW